MDRDDVAWQSPPGASVIVDFLGEIESLLFQLTPDGAGGLDVLSVPGEELAAAFGPMTDTCAVALGAPFALDPAFETTARTFDLETPTGPFTAYDFVVSGALSADAAAIDRLTVRGRVDLRPILENFPNACAVVESAQGECEACPGETDGKSCVFVQLTDASAPWVEGLELAPCP